MIRYIDEEGMISPRGDSVDAGMAKVAVTAFSDHVFGELLRVTGAKPCGEISGSVECKVYSFSAPCGNVALYKSPIGAPAAASALEEIYACGVEHVVAFGICGTLVELPKNVLIVPELAFRDEGTSYHYTPDSEYIFLKGADVVEAAIKRCGVPAVRGGAWTTDGFYRETRARVKEMQSNGCICVDMECSALQAVANFRGKRFYTFFITADSLAAEEWQPNDILDLKVTDMTSAAVRCAVELSKELL